MNETLSEFLPIPEDLEPEGAVQPDLMGFEMPQTTKEVENRGEEGNSPQEGLQEPKLNHNRMLLSLHGRMSTKQQREVITLHQG